MLQPPEGTCPAPGGVLNPPVFFRRLRGGMGHLTGSLDRTPDRLRAEVETMSARPAPGGAPARHPTRPAASVAGLGPRPVRPLLAPHLLDPQRLESATRLRTALLAPVARILVGVLAAAGGSAGCGGDQLQQVAEGYELVGGQPSVDPSRPSIDRAPVAARPGDFASSVPVQVDAFVQKQVQKVDILWIIDNSGSMAPKQQRVRQNFEAFMRKLAESSVDYHIGVVTTDTMNPLESGRLQKKNATLAQPWIDRTCQPPACDPVAVFGQISSVGIRGSWDEKGLLAATMALSPPLTSPGGPNAGFVRDDAALFIILLSDEEDSSCQPVQPFGGCVEPMQFGATDYFSRWLEGLKGFGRTELVTMGAIVATAPAVAIPGTGGAARGCQFTPQPSQSSSDYGFHAPRYVAVAEATGGLAADICHSDYLPALANLGFLATGAKTTFALSRRPDPATLRVMLTPAGGAPRPALPAEWSYEPCGGISGTAFTNSIRFAANAIPPSGTRIEVEYEVLVGGTPRCP